MLVRMSLGFLPVAGLISTAGTEQNFGRATLATTCAFPRAENVTAAVVAARVPLQNTDNAKSGRVFVPGRDDQPGDAGGQQAVGVQHHSPVRDLPRKAARGHPEDR